MRIVAIILFIIFSYQVNCQINVTCGFHKDSIQIGDQVNFTVTAKVRKDLVVSKVFLSKLDSIISIVNTQIKAQTDTTDGGPVMGDYSIDDLGRWEDRNNDKVISGTELIWDTTYVSNEYILENTFKLSFWDAGPHIAFSPKVEYQLSGVLSNFDAGRQVSLFVAPPFHESEMSDSIDIAPLKPIIKEEKNISDFYFYFYILGGLILAMIGYFLFKRIKQEPTVVAEIQVVRSAHEIAFEKLDKLKNEKLWQKGDVKVYQSELTHVIREYLENRYEIQALESTTFEIVAALKEKAFDSEDERDLNNILQVADLVKFAKATPTEDVHEQFLNIAYNFVTKTKLSIVNPESVADD